MTAAPTYHAPVLRDAVADLASGRTAVVDGTAGGGGHLALFVAVAERVLAFDRDPQAVAAANARFGEAVCRLGAFGSPDVLAAIATFRPDFVFLDLGVSSHQLDADERGFSFRPGVTLDMRMDRDPHRLTAAGVLNESDPTELRRIFASFGDEPRAGRLAREIVRRRQRQPFRVSDDLVNAIRAVLGPRSGPPDFARLFQALRIQVNGELDQLQRALPAMRDALVSGGALAVITYHSGEDRAVKHAFREWARTCVCPASQPICQCRGHPLGTLVTRKPVTPDPDELAQNPRARSAKLRVFRSGGTRA